MYHTIRDFCLVVGLMNYSPVNYNTWYQAFSLPLISALQGGCYNVLSLLSCGSLKLLWCDILGFWVLMDISTTLQIYPVFLKSMWDPDLLHATVHILKQSLLNHFKFLSINSIQLYAVLQLFYPIKAKTFLSTTLSVMFHDKIISKILWDHFLFLLVIYVCQQKIRERMETILYIVVKDFSIILKIFSKAS